jgi:hypothetical protein
MKFMHTIKFAGLCLVAMFAMSMATAATASAAPVWEQCETEKAGSASTKYTTDKCATVGAPNAWAWQEVKNTEAVQGLASLTLKDTVSILTVEVGCTGNEHGYVGPGKYDRIQTITEIKCSAGKNCEKLEKNAAPLHLPWQTELTEKEGARRDVISEGTGKLLPGWEVECRVLGSAKKDICENNTGSTAMTNKQVDGSVWAYFDKKSGKAKCTQSGTESGEIEGSVRIVKETGQAVRVS